MGPPLIEHRDARIDAILGGIQARLVFLPLVSSHPVLQSIDSQLMSNYRFPVAQNVDTRRWSGLRPSLGSRILGRMWRSFTSLAAFSRLSCGAM
jgi:hypothetical protein